MFVVLFRVSSDSVLLMMVWKCIGCCFEWVLGGACVEQWV